jgi:penicillin-binding protein 1A
LQKFKEWVIALKLERSYTKQEILTLYLNRADFGRQAFGIQSAAKIYFDKHVHDLSIEEAAALVGMLKAPGNYDPVRKPEANQKRRNVVFGQMVKNKALSPEKADSLSKLPVVADLTQLKERVRKSVYGQGELAGYFLNELKKDLNVWCSNHINPATGKPYNLYRDGLRVYTTIDSRMQRYAEQAVKQHLSELQRDFFRHKKGRKNAPFSARLSDEQVNSIVLQGIKRSDRYRAMKEEGASEAEISRAFNTPVEMTVFSWDGPIDTVMTPRDSVIYYKYFLQNGMMSMDPHTGHVKAWVGGIDIQHFKYDHVRAGSESEDGKSIFPAGGRQVGSTFKPLVYALAMEERRSPCDLVPNTRVCIEEGLSRPWCPDNSGDYKVNRMITLREALANSVNYVSAMLMKEYGPQATIDLARKLGITAPIPNSPSICLGTADISVFEMVGAFSTFFNDGVYCKPFMLTRIEDKNGNTLAVFSPERREALSAETAFLTVQLLRGVVLQGTAQRLRYRYKFTEPIAGKTGTTQNNSDGWFIAGTPDLVTGVWTGAEDRSVHFASTALGQGANMALPVWALYMRKVYDDRSILINRGDFKRPDSFADWNFDCSEEIQDQLQEMREGNTEIDFD